jgi:hypothetical protein
MDCPNCSIKIPCNMYFHRSINITTNNNKGECIKSSVNLTSCSLRCLNEQIKNYNLYVEKETDNQKYKSSFQGNAGY